MIILEKGAKGYDDGNRILVGVTGQDRYFCNVITRNVRADVEYYRKLVVDAEGEGCFIEDSWTYFDELYFEDVSIEDISKRHNISAGSVGNIIGAVLTDLAHNSFISPVVPMEVNDFKKAMYLLGFPRAMVQLFLFVGICRIKCMWDSDRGVLREDMLSSVPYIDTTAIDILRTKGVELFNNVDNGKISLSTLGR